MKVINVIENVDETYGGPAKSVPSLMLSLDKEYFDSELISVSPSGCLSNELISSNKLNITIAKSIFPHQVRYSFSLKKILSRKIQNESDFVVIHSHSLWNYTSYLAWSASVKYSKPLIISVRGNLYSWNLNKSAIKKKLAMFLFQMKMFNDAKCIHATEINEVKAIRDVGIKTPIALIPNGIDTNEFDMNYMSRNEALSHLSFDPEKRYILFMSRIDEKKGVEILIRAFILIHEEFPDFELLIVGPVNDKNYFNKLIAMVSNSNLESKIKFLGMATGVDRLAYYFASDIFVLPTHSENFGMVIGEALAAKRPVITTTGAPWMSLNSSNSGWCIELSLANLTNTLKQALSLSDEDLQLMGNNGYELVKQNYSWSSVGKKMQILYEWVSGKEVVVPEFVFLD